MIMRVSWGKIRPGMWDRFEQLWSESAARMRDSAGLRAHWLLKDPEHVCAGYSISLWDSMEAIDAAPAMGKIKPELAECFTGQYVLSCCEVRASDMAGLMSGRSA